MSSAMESQIRGRAYGATSQGPTWVRNQILANAKFLYPRKSVFIITGREPVDFMQFDGSFVTEHLHYAHLCAMVDDQPAPQQISKRSGERSEDGARINGDSHSVGVLVYGTSIRGTTEAAIGLLLGKVEDQVNEALGRLQMRAYGGQARRDNRRCSEVKPLNNS